MIRSSARAAARVAPRSESRRPLLLLVGLLVASLGVTSLLSAQSPHATSSGSQMAVELVASANEVTLPASSAVSGAAPVIDGAVGGTRSESYSTLGGPRLTEGAVAFKPSATAQLYAPASNELPLNRPATRNNAALIVVGLSAMVIGSFVDDDAGNIIVLGGAGVTLYGLWQYLK